MANNHIRLGGPDPMDSMFTSNYSVDLTKPTTQHKISQQPVNLSDLDSIQQNQNSPVSTTRPTGVPVNAHMSQSVQEFDPTTLIPKKEKVDEGANEVYNALDMAIEREKKSISERHAALEEQMYEDFLNRDESKLDPTANYPYNPADDIYDKNDSESDDYEDSVADDEVEVYERPVINIHIENDTNDTPIEEPVSIKRSVSEDFAYDDDEVEADLNTDEPKLSPEEQQEKEEKEMKELVDGLKAAAKETVKPRMNKIDLKKFKISNKPVKAATVILKESDENPIADWVMYESGYPISMSGLTGPELIKLDPNNSNRNRMNTIKDIYKIIYDHVVDSNKPSFDAWLKQTKYDDLDHIYFALYMATFNGSNFVSYRCPDCHKVFIKDVNFRDMVTFKNDEVEKKVRTMMDQNTDVGKINYEIDLIQASNKYVFGMKTPSLYNIVMETAGLPENIMQKYSDLIDTISYIDSVYTIDYVNNELIPITIPSVKDDPVKSTIKRIKTLYDILKRLNSDEYYVLRGYIAKVDEKGSEISYKVPAAKCPDCDTEVEENTEITASGLLFTRHHLGAFASM